MNSLDFSSHIPCDPNLPKTFGILIDKLRVIEYFDNENLSRLKPTAYHRDNTDIAKKVAAVENLSTL